MNSADKLSPIHRLAYEAVVEMTEALRTLCRRGLLSVSLDRNKNPMFKLINPPES